MLLTAPLLSKSSFLGSLINKCRQVIKPQKTPSTTTTNNTTKNKNINFTPSSSTENRPTRPALFNNNNNNNNNNKNETVSHISTTTTSLKTIEEQVGLPPRPKKPMTPFFRYLRDMRPKMLAENPKSSTVDMVRELSKKWPTVDQNIKQRLMDEYKREREIYVAKRIKYDAKLTPEQVSEIKEKKQELAELKERRKVRERVKALGRPKRPSSAFLLFIQKERVSTPQLPQETYRDWHKKCTAKWARLSDAEKESYLKEAQLEFDKYKKTLAVWEQKMMALGNLDVVRTTHLIDPSESKPKRMSKSVEPKPTSSKPKKS